VTEIPIYGELRGKLDPTLAAIFGQKNFKDKSLVENIYLNAN
jgi:hypothetical protein